MPRFRATTTDKQWPTQDGHFGVEIMVERVKGYPKTRAVVTAPARLEPGQILAVEQLPSGLYCLTGSWRVAEAEGV